MLFVSNTMSLEKAQKTYKQYKDWSPHINTTGPGRCCSSEVDSKVIETEPSEYIAHAPTRRSHLNTKLLWQHTPRSTWWRGLEETVTPEKTLRFYMQER